MNIERLLEDNPNASSSILSKLTGIKVRDINRVRLSSLWRYDCKGIPFTNFVVDKDKAYHRVRKNGRTLFKGSLAGAIEQTDRLIHCLENNNGKLPPTLSEWSLSDLEFIK